MPTCKYMQPLAAQGMGGGSFSLEVLFGIFVMTELLNQ